ncbi:hypothetical protein P879_11142 [Paragonimus westermani]|uniref:Uncharacterized protein n=1 Tax=Paragonimus westermani TaxID=34504 RepID=A0A8T0DC24_9TREM|nr:hypothetical protein P879_11142 [Paragonimus westermani]
MYTRTHITAKSTTNDEHVVCCFTAGPLTQTDTSGSTEPILQVLDLAKIQISQWKNADYLPCEILQITPIVKKLQESKKVELNSKSTRSRTHAQRVEKEVDATKDFERSEAQQDLKTSSRIVVIIPSPKKQPETVHNPSIDFSVNPGLRSFSAGVCADRPIGSRGARPVSALEDTSNSQCQPSFIKQSGRLGNLYLFNSFPQPTPANTKMFNQLDQPVSLDRGSCLWYDNLESTTQSTRLQRVSVDRQSVRQITQKEVNMKATSARLTPPNECSQCKSPQLLSPIAVNLITRHLPKVDLPSDSPSPKPHPVTDDLSTLIAPLDLGDYAQTDDLSASFEASLLASLKMASSMSKCQQSDLQAHMDGSNINTTFFSKLNELKQSPRKYKALGPSQFTTRIPLPQKTFGEFASTFVRLALFCGSEFAGQYH